MTSFYYANETDKVYGPQEIKLRDLRFAMARKWHAFEAPGYANDPVGMRPSQRNYRRWLAGMSRGGYSLKGSKFMDLFRSMR